MGTASTMTYANNLHFLHGMINDITLFKKGKVKSTKVSSQPILGKKFVDIIKNRNWNEVELKIRARSAA